MPYVDGAFTGSLFGDEWKELGAEDYRETVEDSEEEWEEEDEEIYVTLDLGAVDPLAITSAAEYQLIGLDTPTPYLKIGNHIFLGSPTELIGDEIILRDTRDPKNPIKHSHPAVGTTRSLRIAFQQVNLVPHAQTSRRPAEAAAQQADQDVQRRPVQLVEDPLEMSMPMEIPADGRLRTLVGGERVKKKPRGRPFPKKVPVPAAEGDGDVGMEAGPSTGPLSLTELSLDPTGQPKKRSGRPKGAKDTRPRLPRGARALLADGQIDATSIALPGGRFVFTDGQPEKTGGEKKKRKKRERKVMPGLFGDPFPISSRTTEYASESPAPTGSNSASGSAPRQQGRPTGSKNKPKPLLPPGFGTEDTEMDVLPEINSDFVEGELKALENEEDEEDEDDDDDEEMEGGDDDAEAGLERMDDSDGGE